MVLNLNIQQSEDAELFERFSSTDQKSAVYEGKDKYIVFARIPATSWYLVFHLPYSEVNRPLHKLTLIFVFGILVALLVLGITTRLISQFISQPILYLANGAGRIAEGQYETQVQVNSRDEVGYLTQCFNNMVKGLKERDFIKSTFGKYVTPQVMNEILAGKVELGGEKRTATILFSDIRDFTGFAEQTDPRTIVPLLNDYFTLMDAAVTKYHGSINKYLGDGFLALFGAPLALESAPMCAVQAAMDMRQSLETFNLRNNMAFRIGIGIHTGVAVVGNIGSESRMEYTVIGDSVNVSSRIESLCKVYGQDILISEDAAMYLPESYKQQIIDRVQVRGKQDTICMIVLHLVEESGASMVAFVRSSNEIMDHYFAGRFQEAIDMIKVLRKEQRESIHMQIIRSRCETFLKDPPADWEGVLPI